MRATPAAALQRNGCSRLWFWSADALWHLGGFRREHTDTKDKAACKVGASTEFSMSVAPNLFERAISDTRFGVTVSPLPSNAKLLSTASLLPYPFLKLLCWRDVTGRAQLKQAMGEKGLTLHTQRGDTPDTPCHCSCHGHGHQPNCNSPWLQFLLHWDQRRTSSQNCTTSISWVLPALCQSLVPNIAPRPLET